ncbi:MAG: chemotaxis protein CheB [Acidimicrobiales bacterium]
MTPEEGVDHERNQPAFDAVAIAASAGGVSALGRLASGLSADFGAAVLVVQHIDPRRPSLMAQILARQTTLVVSQAADGDQLQPGRMYVALPDRHLLATTDHTCALSRSALVHFVRPSADLLFESMAEAYRERSIAVVLTGTGRDGSMGLRAVKEAGGKVIVQDEATSEFFGMPSAAIETGDVDLVLALDAIAPTLVELVMPGGNA